MTATFCPVPHTSRDQVWLTVGALLGGAVAWHVCRPCRSTTKPGFLLVQIDVRDGPADKEALFAEYKRRVAPLIARFGGEYLVRGGTQRTVEGEQRGARTAVLRFPSVESAQQFYDAPEYTELKTLRISASTSGSVTLVEGV